jgi:DNA-binding protein HU-beta
MNRAALIDFVQKGMGEETTRAVADRAVTLVIEGIKSGLKNDKSVQLVGFGTFKVVERKARTGVHPKTLDKIKISRSRTVKLAVGKDLKSRI